MWALCEIHESKALRLRNLAPLSAAVRWVRDGTSCTGGEVRIDFGFIVLPSTVSSVRERERERQRESVCCMASRFSLLHIPDYDPTSSCRTGGILVNRPALERQA